MILQILNHFDLAEEFSAAEVAALIAGIDPADPSAQHHRAAPALARVRNAYEVARRLVAGHPMSPEQFPLQMKSRWFAHALASKRIDAYPVNQKVPGLHGGPECEWELPRRFKGEYGDIDQQRFERQEIQRWIDAVELASVYKFFPEVSPAAPTPSTESAAAHSPAARDQKTPLTDAEKQEIVALWNHGRGLKPAKLAQQYGKSRTAIDKVLVAAGAKPTKGAGPMNSMGVSLVRNSRKAR